jgi:hypothetical protein
MQPLGTDEANNPYAPPAAPAQSKWGTTGLYREGDVLCVLHGSSFPERCVKCNAPAIQPVKSRTIYWHAGWVYALVLFNPIIYVIVGMIIRKKAVISPGLCAVHESRRQVAIIVMFLGVVTSIVMFVEGLRGDSYVLALAGVLAMIPVVIFGILNARIVYPVRIDGEASRLKGCGREFLESLGR